MVLAGQPRCFLDIVIGLDSARHAVSWLVKVRVCVRQGASGMSSSFRRPTETEPLREPPDRLRRPRACLSRACDTTALEFVFPPCRRVFFGASLLCVSCKWNSKKTGQKSSLLSAVEVVNKPN